MDFFCHLLCKASEAPLQRRDAQGFRATAHDNENDDDNREINLLIVVALELLRAESVSLTVGDRGTFLKKDSNPLPSSSQEGLGFLLRGVQTQLVSNQVVAPQPCP